MHMSTFVQSSDWYAGFVTWSDQLVCKHCNLEYLVCKLCDLEWPTCHDMRRACQLTTPSNTALPLSHALASFLGIVALALIHDTQPAYCLVQSAVTQLLQLSYDH
jgi:hypothetical protein